MNPELDADYGILCGVPRLRRIHYWGAWYTVYATDIGRANQPAPCDADACAAVEQLPGGAERTQRLLQQRPQCQRIAKFSVEEKIQRCLNRHGDGISISYIASRCAMPPEEVLAHVEAHPDVYETFVGAKKSTRVRRIGAENTYSRDLSTG